MNDFLQLFRNIHCSGRGKCQGIPYIMVWIYRKKNRPNVSLKRKLLAKFITKQNDKATHKVIFHGKTCLQRPYNGIFGQRSHEVNQIVDICGIRYRAAVIAHHIEVLVVAHCIARQEFVELLV